MKLEYDVKIALFNHAMLKKEDNHAYEFSKSHSNSFEELLELLRKRKHGNGLLEGLLELILIELLVKSLSYFGIKDLLGRGTEHIHLLQIDRENDFGLIPEDQMLSNLLYL